MRLILQANVSPNQPFDLDTVEDYLMVESVRSDGVYLTCTTGGVDIFLPIQRASIIFPRGGKVRFLSPIAASVVVYVP